MRYILIFILFIVAVQVKGQLNKGTVLIGGGAGLNVQSNDHEFARIGRIDYDKAKYTNLTLRPEVGVFTSSTTLIGIGLSCEYAGVKWDNTYNGTSRTYKGKETLYLVNPYLEKYIELSDKFYFNLRFNVLVGGGSQKEGDDNNLLLSIREFRVNVSPGFSYFISDKWSLSCRIGQLYYNMRKEIDETNSSSEKPVNNDQEYGLSFQLNTFSLGLQYYINNNSE